MSNLHDVINNIHYRFPNLPLLLLGDFNFPNITWSSVTPYSNPPSSECTEFLNLCSAFNLSQLVTEPTRVTPSTANVLDLILTSSPDIVTSISCLPGLSDHSLLHFLLTAPVSRTPNERKKIRDYSRADFSSINNVLGLYIEEFMTGFFDRSVNTNWTLFREKVASLTNEYIPVKAIISNAQSPWYNQSLRRLSNRKKRFFRSAKLSNCPERWQTYERAQVEYKQAVSEAKTNFLIHTLPEMLKSNPTRFWNIVNKRDKLTITLKTVNDEIISKSQCSTVLNDIFSGSFSNTFVLSNPQLNINQFFPMFPLLIDPDGIVKIIDSLKLSSATGIDNINTKFLKNTKMYSSIILAQIFQQSLDSGELPFDWKVAKVIPLHKAGDKHNPNNYRPISLTSIPCKIMEHIIYSNLVNFLEANSFFTSSQHGFRKSYSCETQLLCLTNELHFILDSGSQADCVFLDFSKAFDKVSHKLLLFKLTKLNIDTSVLAWISSFLANRTQFVTCNDINSSETAVTSGVPQGSVLGPLLFLIYINDLPQHVSSSISLFADDCVIYREITNECDSYLLQSDLNAVSTWCETWLMELNINKCKHMRVSRRPDTSPSYHLKDIPLQSVVSYKYLGVHITYDLSWKTHTEYVINNANRTLGYIRRNFNIAPSSLRLFLYKTLVRPKLEYAASVWDPGLESLIKAIEVIQNTAARFILGNYNRTASVSSMKTNLSLPTLVERRKFFRLRLFHKIYFHNRILKQRLLIPPSYVSSRIDHSHKVGIPFCDTNKCFMSFIPTTSSEWNALPGSITQITDSIEFSRAITSYFSLFS